MLKQLYLLRCELVREFVRLHSLEGIDRFI